MNSPLIHFWSVCVSCLSNVFPHTYMYMQEVETNPSVKPWDLFEVHSPQHFARTLVTEMLREDKPRHSKLATTDLSFASEENSLQFLCNIWLLIFSEELITIMWSLLYRLNNCKIWSQVAMKELLINSFLKITFPDYALWQIKAVAKNCPPAKT